MTTRREFALDTAAVGLAGLIAPPWLEASAQVPVQVPAHTAAPGIARFDQPVQIARYGQYFIGAQGAEVARGTVINGTQMSVEYQIPADVRHADALVLVHGDGGQASDWISTPDARMGWASLLLQQGYKVYLVDRPAQGRPPYHPQFHGAFRDAVTYERMAQEHTANEHRRSAHNPYAHLHTQWPGSGEIGDPALDQLMAAQGPAFAGSAAALQLWRARAAMLLDDIGPAVILTHGDSAAFGWLAADARPKRVRALIALEPGAPAGPPAFGPAGPRVQDLKNLKGLAAAVVTAEASASNLTDPQTVQALRQAGCDAQHLRLADHGIHGNGHYMMMEKNNREILQLLLRWLDGRAASSA